MKLNFEYEDGVYWANISDNCRIEITYSFGKMYGVDLYIDGRRVWDSDFTGDSMPAVAKECLQQVQTALWRETNRMARSAEKLKAQSDDLKV